MGGEGEREREVGREGGRERGKKGERERHFGEQNPIFEEIDATMPGFLTPAAMSI